MVEDLPLLDLAQRLRTSSHQLQIPKVDVKHVRTRVQAPELSVGVERMQGRRSRETLTRHGLDDVSLDDVLLELGHEGLVSFLSDVGGEVLVGDDKGLDGEGSG